MSPDIPNYNGKMGPKPPNTTHRFPKILVEVVAYLNSVEIPISKKRDGRLASTEDEDTVFDLLVKKFGIENVIREPIERIGAILQNRYELTPLNFTKTKNIMPYVDKMFDLFNQSYAVLPSFVPISQLEIDYFKKKYISFINPEYIKFVVDKDDKMIAFAITMPSFSKAFKYHSLK